MVEEAWKLHSEAEDHQQEIAGAPEGTPSVCQLLGGPSINRDPQTQKAECLDFCLMLLDRISDIEYASKYP